MKERGVRLRPEIASLKWKWRRKSKRLKGNEIGTWSASKVKNLETK